MVRMQYNEMKQPIKIKDIKVIRQKMIKFSRWMRLWKPLVLMSSKCVPLINGILILCQNQQSLVLNMINIRVK